jgi:hypothetical protein
MGLELDVDWKLKIHLKSTQGLVSMVVGLAATLRPVLAVVLGVYLVQKFGG